MLRGVHASYRPAGIRFVPVSTPHKETLPRMDVAVFVGFASQGRLHEPWLVESVHEFTREFGEDLPLAWDWERGEEVRAYLAPAVRSFFSNGGRRCWIIRVDDPVDADGSARFSANLFLDHDLKNMSTEQLINQADFLRYQSPAPRKLKGIHAALEIEEATMIAVPDAVHLGWKYTRYDEPAIPEIPVEPAVPASGDFMGCWPGEVADKKSDAPLGDSEQVMQSQRWQQNSIKRYSSRSLLIIQRALLCLCASRGDMTAVLSMPAHFRETAALRHVRKLTGTEQRGNSALGFAALYHPWLISRDDGRPVHFRTVPPDGAICGMMAHRAQSRGAWVAPANEAIKDVVALTPPISGKSRLSLQESQINLILREQNGFIVSSADTLCDDRDLRPINVRRLLILIRKQALRKGAEYVFEANDASFRRMVQRGFEAMLDDMFLRGAFSGARSSLAYQVTTGSSLNTPHSLDQGRFIVELKVAPSRPMTFLTIRLMQTGDRMSIAEGA